MLIKNGIKYKRIFIVDRGENPIVAIRDRSKKFETATIIGHHHQWKMRGEERQRH